MVNKKAKSTNSTTSRRKAPATKKQARKAPVAVKTKRTRVKIEEPILESKASKIEKIVYTVSFSHSDKPVAGVRSNIKAAFGLVEPEGPNRNYNQVRSELRQNNITRIALADNRVATIEAMPLSAK